MAVRPVKNKAGGEDNITVIIAQTLTSSEDDHA